MKIEPKVRVSLIGLAAKYEHFAVGYITSLLIIECIVLGELGGVCGEFRLAGDYLAYKYGKGILYTIMD